MSHDSSARIDKQPQEHQHIDSVLATLDKRRRFAGRLFSEYCERSDLPAVIGPRRRWAIVGGAVRDALLSAHIEARTLFDPWQDIDVAVGGRTAAPLKINHRGHFTMRRNSFGGLKLQGDKTGTVDIWRWPDGDGKRGVSWIEKLELIDFGLNAVVFLWPEAEIIVHPRWIKDLKRRTIEKLSDASIDTGVQVVRAIALKVKLELLSGESFQLGERILADLSWLVARAGHDEALHALRYLRGKTEERRWSTTAFDNLLTFAKTANASSAFSSAAQEVCEHLLGANNAPTKPRRTASSRRQADLDL
jgi:hypothetical protein